MNTLLVNANALSIPLASCRLHCCVTSPPYWALRDYGTPGQLGLEPTPDEYVANMVAVFREVKRVLRDDGTLWLNLGDSYNGSGGAGGDYAAGGLKEGQPKYPGRNASSLKPKDLVGIPWRVAFALQADGWYLRSDIIWSKPNPMPESVTDRPTKSHEYLFLLAKSKHYYYDADAIREKRESEDGGWIRGWASEGEHTAVVHNRPKEGKTKFGNRAYSFARAVTEPERPGQDHGNHRPDREDVQYSGSRNKRTVWTIAPNSFSGAHFATYPPALVEPCIKAGTSERGVCPRCGAPWRRDTERTAMVLKRSERTHPMGRTRSSGTMLEPPTSITTGWSPTCTCDAGEPVPATVLDPFNGAATTGLVCQQLGRRYVGLDLSPEYLRLSRERLGHEAWDAWVNGKPAKDDVDLGPLFA